MSRQPATVPASVLEAQLLDGRRPARSGDRWRAGAVLVLLTALVMVPLSWSLWLSLHAGGPGGSGVFVGIDNYVAVLSSSQWWTTMATTAVIAVGLTTVQLVIALTFAVALWHVALAWWPARFLALVPAGVGLIVGAHAGRAAVDGGFLSAWFGFDGSGATAALAGVVLGELWRTTGLVVVLLHLALSRVPAELLDSAAADGATSMQRWRRVTWPAAAGAVGAVALFRLLDSWRLLDGPLLVREPGSFHTSASALVADNAFVIAHSTGPAAAGSVVFVLLTALLVAVVIGAVKVVRLR